MYTPLYLIQNQDIWIFDIHMNFTWNRKITKSKTYEYLIYINRGGDCRKCRRNAHGKRPITSGYAPTTFVKINRLLRRVTWWRRYIMLQCVATHCNTLQHTATQRNILQPTASQTIFTTLNRLLRRVTWWRRYIILQTHCNTLQHIVTHCNTLQHTASHCITNYFDQTQ